MSIVSLFYVAAFLLRAFITGMFTEIVSRYQIQHAYIIPITMEICMLTAAVLMFGEETVKNHKPLVFSSMLLFAMGLQNALVTKISQFVVRTTHLTGLFTDLGIELAQLFVYKQKEERTRVNRSVLLKFIIIGCFFTGGLTSGFLYILIGIKTLLIPSAFLLFTLWYDTILFRFYSFKRRLKH